MPVSKHDELTPADAGGALRQAQSCGGRDESSAPAIPADEPPVMAATRKGLLALLAAVACTVLGSRLIVISAFGSPVPILDQWDGEGGVLYSRYLNGTLSFADLVAPHNGHRILITRLMGLGHLEMAGEWNTRLEMILSAMVLTALITWLAAVLMPLVAPHRRILFSCFVALVFAPPIDFENTLWGFQSQVYLSLLFGLATLVVSAAAAPFSLRWFGGLGAGTLACFTFATGVAASAAAGMLVSLQLATNARKRCRREVAGVSVMAFVAVPMVLYESYSTETKSTFWTFAAGLGVFAVLTAAGGIPIILYCRHTLTSRPGFTDRAWVIIAISAWVAIQIVLFAYGRGTRVAPRYMAVVLLVYPVALVALFALADRARTSGAHRRKGQGSLAWVCTLVAAISVAGCLSVLACSYWSKAAKQQTVDVQAYLATGGVDHLEERGSSTNGVVLNHPFPERQASVLKNPAVRAILPPGIRPPDADNAKARDRMLLKGKLAGFTASAVHFMLSLSPALLALGIGLFIAVGTARNVSESLRTPRGLIRSK